MSSPRHSSSFARRLAARLTVAIVVGATLFSTASASNTKVDRTPQTVPGAPESFHLRLEKSEPSKDAELAKAPTAIHLWFSLPPEMAVTAVKLADADGKAIAVGKPHRGSGATAPVDVDITGALHPGSYTVSWKTASKDGHPVTGDFSFTVKAAE